MKIKLRTKGFLLVLIGAMLWGVSGTVAQFLFQEKSISPEWLVVIRLLLSGILLLLYTSLLEKKDIFKILTVKADLIALIFFSIIGMLGVQYTYFAAIKHGNAATATVLQYLSPVVITVYLTLKLKKFPKKTEFVAVLLALLGTFLLITKGSFNSLSISVSAVFWGILSAITAAFYTLYPRRILKTWGAKIVVGWGMTIGGVLFSFIHQPWNVVGEISFQSIIGIGFVVLFGTLVAFYCYLESLNYIEPTEAVVLASAEPLSAALLSVLWLRETLDFIQWLGILFILLTIQLLSLSKKNEKSERAVNLS